MITQTLSIDWNLMSLFEMRQLLEQNYGYIDGDKKTVEVYV